MAGKLEVAYRELPFTSLDQPKHHVFQRRLADKLHTVEAELSLQARPEGGGAPAQIIWGREVLRVSQLRPVQVREEHELRSEPMNHRSN